MKCPEKIDLHMHSTVSDGTDEPQEIIAKVRKAGITLFSVTDHDAVKQSDMVSACLRENDPKFITGVEFSCKDERGQYHILGYGYDPKCRAITDIVEIGHSFRMNKLHARLAFLRSEFRFEFPDEELQKLYDMDNPGKPHIANMMIRLGYAESRSEAISKYINKIHFGDEYVLPEQAVEGILQAGGIPVLAHPAYGSGDQIILEDDMDRRLKRLKDYGLQGMECFYSGFTDKIREEMLGFAEKYGLYVTAGSDYHGKNKMISLGDTGIEEDTEIPAGMVRFLAEIGI